MELNKNNRHWLRGLRFFSKKEESPLWCLACFCLIEDNISLLTQAPPETADSQLCLIDDIE